MNPTSTQNGLIVPIAKTGKKLPSRILIHAVQKWGKTSFAAQAPKPIFFLAPGEDGLLTLIDNGELPETPYLDAQVKTFTDLKAHLRSILLAEKWPFSTLVIDTLNGIEPLLINHCIEKDFEGSRKNYDAWNKGQKTFLGEYIKELLSILDEIRLRKNMAIILICHSQVKTFTNPEGPNYDRWEPTLVKEFWALVDRWVDAILFGNFEVLVDAAPKQAKGKGMGGQTRIIYTERHAAYDAGNRLGLPPEIDCGATPQEAWANFKNALKTKVHNNKPSQPKES